MSYPYGAPGADPRGAPDDPPGGYPGGHPGGPDSGQWLSGPDGQSYLQPDPYGSPAASTAGFLPQAGPPTANQPGYPPPGYPQQAYAPVGYPQPGYPQPGYPQPGYPQPAYAAGPANGLGTAALVLGIIGVVLFWTAWVGIILNVLAIIFGGIGIQRANAGRATNRSSAVAGLVLGIIGIALFFLVLMTAFAALRSV